MKKNNHPFSHPTRQSGYAIVLIIIKYIRVIVRQIWPILLVLIVGGGSSKKDIIIFVASGIALFSMIWAIIAFFKYTFYVSNKELIVEKGVLRRSKTSIPFDRIQTVNFQQNILHQVLNVIQLDVDTAGSKGNEFSFDALSRENAYTLRDLLLSAKEAMQEDSGKPEERVIPERTLVARLDIPDLLKIGVSQNHLRSSALIFVAAFWLIESLGEVGFETRDFLELAFDQSLETEYSIFLFLAILLLFISFLISLVRTVINYYNLHLYREQNRYLLVAGLLTRKEISIADHKIQIVEWNDNLIMRLFRMFDLKLKQASSVQVMTQKSINIPGCYPNQIQYIVNNWLGNTFEENMPFTGVSIHYFYRRLLYRMIFTSLLIGVFAILNQWILLGLSFLLIPYYIYTSWLSYKKAGFAINQEILYVRKGMFGDDYAVMPVHKIQSLTINQTPYQSRNLVSNLRIFSASGSLDIPYIPIHLAHHLHDYLIYKVEISKKRWM